MTGNRGELSDIRPLRRLARRLSARHGKDVRTPGTHHSNEADDARAEGLSPVHERAEDVQLAPEHREVLLELVLPVGIYCLRLVECRGCAVERILTPAEVVADSPHRLHGGRIVSHI